MSKKSKILYLTLAMICSFGLACAFLPQNMKEADALKLGVTLFDVRKMQLEDVAQASETSSYVDKRKGLRLTGESGAKAILKDTVSGTFDLEFMPESGLSELALEFTNVITEEEFSLVVSFGNYELNAYIESNDEKAGLYYSSNGLIESTTAYNSIGKYTILPNEYSAVRFSFDPERMDISINERLVWHLKDNENDQKVVDFSFDSFNEYNVSIKYQKTEGMASGFLYAINGQAFDNILLKAKVEPRIFADFSYSPVVNRIYKLPDVYGYDVVEGQLDTDNCNITFISGPEELEIIDNEYIYPTTAGEYYLKYSLKNSLNIEGSRVFLVKIEEDYTGSIVYEGDLPSKEFGVHTKVELPSAIYKTTQLSRGDTLPVTSELYRDGVLIEVIENMSDGYDYFVSAPGVYTVIYKPKHNYFAADEDIHTFTVVEDLVGFQFSEKLKGNYVLGESVSIPALTLQSASGDVICDYVVEAPEGTIYDGKDVKSFIIEYPGEYTIKYTATIADEEYYFEKKFVAEVDITKLFSTQGLTSIQKGTYRWNNKYSGLCVDLARNTELVYNNVIDLSTYDYYGDKANALLLKGLIDPQKAFISDIAYFRVVLSDAENPENYVEINLSNWDEATDANRAVLRASVNGGVEVGLQWSGSSYTVSKDRLGFVCNSSLSAQPYATYGEIKPFEIYFDYKNLQVHSALFNPKGAESTSLVADLDDVAQFGKEWAGFTSGKVILSMYATGMKNSSSRILLMNVDGIDLSCGNFEDNEVPQIFVDLPQALPIAVEGMKYPLIAGYANDKVDGYVKLQRDVYFVGPNGKLFNIQEDEDYFIPQISGEYIIRYWACDKAGNIGYLDYQLTAVKADYYDTHPLSIVLSKNYSISGIQGEACDIAEVTSIIGGSGEAVLNRLITGPDGEILDVDGNVFIPEQAGTYTVNFVLTDYLGQSTTESYKIIVEKNNGVVYYTDALNLPKAILRGKTVTLPKLQMVDYTSGEPRNSIAVATIVNDETGEVLLHADENGNIKLDDDKSNVTIRYICPTNSEQYFDFENIPVVNAEKNLDGRNVIDLSGWFYSDKEYTVGLNEKALVLRTAVSGNRIAYLNSVLAANFGLSMNVDKDTADNFQAFSVYLSDSVNPRIMVKATIIKAGDKIQFSLNNGQTIDMEGSFTGQSNYSIAINYSPKGHIISDNARVDLCAITRTFYGEAFTGFTSGKICIEFAFECTGEAELCIQKINNQFFNSKLLADTVAPEINVQSTIGGFYSIGDVISIPDFVVADVLHYSEQYVTVKMPSGKNALDEQGNVLLSYKYHQGQSFVLSEAGNYILYLIGIDEQGKQGSVTITIVVEDTVAPTINVSGVPKKISLGQTVALPEAIVSDDATATSKLQVYIYVIDNQGIMNSIDDYTFAPTRRGKYTIRYLVRDAYYNYSFVDFTIEVI